MIDAEAVQSYLHVNTPFFFSAKMEIWLALVMNEGHGVTDIVGAMEFAVGRGVIHFNMLCKMMNPAVQQWQPALAVIAGMMHCCMLRLFCREQ